MSAFIQSSFVMHFGEFGTLVGSMQIPAEPIVDSPPGENTTLNKKKATKIIAVTIKNVCALFFIVFHLVCIFDICSFPANASITSFLGITSGILLAGII